MAPSGGRAGPEMLRLHGFCQSGNSFKAAFALRAMGLPYESVFVDFMHGQTRDATWRAEINAMGEAPVLDDGPLRLTQSGVILMHLARKSGRFAGRDEAEQRDVLRWLLFDNHKFTSYFATYRFMRAFGPTAPDPAVLAFLKTRIDGAYGIVDKHLSARDWLVGDAPTIADYLVVGLSLLSRGRERHRRGQEPPAYRRVGAAPSPHRRLGRPVRGAARRAHRPALGETGRMTAPACCRSPVEPVGHAGPTVALSA